MRELIGQCHVCRRHIYCENGFMNGFIDSEGKLSCFDENHLELQAKAADEPYRNNEEEKT